MSLFLRTRAASDRKLLGKPIVAAVLIIVVNYSRIRPYAYCIKFISLGNKNAQKDVSSTKWNRACQYRDVNSVMRLIPHYRAGLIVFYRLLINHRGLSEIASRRKPALPNVIYEDVCRLRLAGAFVVLYS